MTASTETTSLEIQEREFQKNFPARGFKIQHRLCDRAEFGLTRLVQLAQTLPSSEVEYFSGKVGVSQDPGSHPRNGLSIAETVRRIEECGSWMVLKNVQTDPEYGQMLRSVLDEVYSHCDKVYSGRHREEAFIFISSPNSVTPFHLDEEHNFLLQIRGTKQVSMWDPEDRLVLNEQQAEHMLQVSHGPDYHRNMPFQEAFQERATVFDLLPGQGLHFPVGAPHWVKNGPAVSISFSVTFRSRVSERQAVVYYVNKRLRKLGLQPTPPSESGWRDSLKYRAYQLARGAKRALPR